MTGCAAPLPAPTDAAAADARDERTTTDVVVADSGMCVDQDNDGHPSAACGGDDCDDSNPRRNPGVREVCDALGADEDCDPCTVGEVSPGGIGGDGDRDEDGFPSRTCFNRLDPGSPPPSCSAATTPVDGGSDGGTFARLTISSTETRGTDCDDGSRSRSPAISEVCDAAMLDENCNGAANEGCACVTGQAVSCMGTRGECARGMQDCIDGQLSMCSIAAVDETCDMRDNDCDGETDEGLRVPCYRDVDSDGHAPAAAVESQECGVLQPDGTSTCPGGFTARAPTAGQIDCNDNNALQSPSLAEIPCNGLDDDCVASTSDTSCAGGMTCMSGGCQCGSGQALCAGRCQAVGAACTIGTGFCANTAGRTACTTTGMTQSVTCTGSPLAAPVWYRDCDGDGRGDPSITGVASCATPTTRCGTPLMDRPMVRNMTDCAGADNDPNSYSGATERCDGVDNNCNGQRDETFSCVRGSTARTETLQFASNPTSCSRACSLTCSGPQSECYVSTGLLWNVTGTGFGYPAGGGTVGGDGSFSWSGIWALPGPFLTDTAPRLFNNGTRYTVSLDYAINGLSTGTFSVLSGSTTLASVSMPTTSGARRTVSTTFAVSGSGSTVNNINVRIALPLGGSFVPITIYRVSFSHSAADPYTF